MTEKRLVVWKSKEDCIAWHKERESCPIDDWVARSMEYGNYLSLESVKEITKNYNVKVMGGVE